MLPIAICPRAAGRAGILLSAMLLAAGFPRAAAQEKVKIRFDAGATGTTINGAITGREYIDYVLAAQAGQAMHAALKVTGTNGHGSVFFNILPAGKDYDGLYVGSTDDDSTAQVNFPSSGNWAIRVYLMGNDKDAGKTVSYSIDVQIPSPQGSVGAIGADTFQVAGVADNDVLNVRSGPGTNHGISGALANGDLVRKLGCEDHGSSRWCQIEMIAGMHERGWVNARYLTAAVPRNPITQ